MYTYELFIVEDGFGFNILCDGNIIITQEYAPDKNGFIVMSETEAINYSNVVISRLEA